jgi:hypothetical protein
MSHPFPSHAGRQRVDERLDLVAHARCCALQRGRWFTLRCAAEALHAAVAPRFVTSLVAVFGLFGALTLAL